jgi:murein L,D-transpeptidase YcbB/YkuD
MQTAIKYYQAVVATGGWKPLPMIKLKSGVRHPAVVLLRRRLELTRDLAQSRRYSKRFGYELAEAVKRFQKRHGLLPTGIVNRSTILALNVPAEARLRQLRINLSRLRTLSGSAAKKYVVVNIPAAQIEAVDHDEVVSRHAAVVGKVDRRTPILRSNIHQINFNPYWHIPVSIVRKDLVPRARIFARRGKDILGEFRIDAFSGTRKLDPLKINWNSPAVYSYTYRQRPWKDNSMGFVKINFHNPYSVYMHDTPSKSLFSRNFRAHSSGCVRVQNVKQLVSWLLAANAGWDMGRITQMEQAGERKDVALKRSVPVYFVYVTAWTTKDGVVNFRRDLYGRDRVGATASAY